MSRTLFTVAALTGLVLARPLAAQTSIERLAPENSVLIAGSRNVDSLIGHVKGTGLWSLWENEEVKAMRADAMKQMSQGLSDLLEDLGVEEGSLVPPSGAVGLAVFPDTNPELGTPELALIAFADYGDAEKADKTATLIEAALARGKRDGAIDFQENDVNGKAVTSIDLSKLKPPPELEDEEFDDFEMGGPFSMFDPAAAFDGLKKLHYVREGDSFILSSSMEALTNALEAAADRGAVGAAGAGAGANARAADRPEFKSIMTKIGEGDAYLVLLTRDLMDVLGGADQMGMIQMMRPLSRALVGKVDGYGVSMRFDAPAAMTEQKFAIYMPEGKRGFTSLIDTPVAGAELPAFAGPDTLGYTTINVEFSNLMEAIRQVVNSHPMLQARAAEQLPLIEESMRPLLSSLGTRVHIVNSATKPFTAQSQHMVIAIECTKPQEFETAFGAMAAERGMEARDFLGQRIYTLDPQGMVMPGMDMEQMPPSSIGIGGGFVVIGQTAAVEHALRATSQPAAGGLSTSADFQRAFAALPRGEAVAWGYSSTVDSLEATLAAQRQQMDKLFEQIREQDPALAEQLQAEQPAPMLLLDKLNFDLLRDYIGPGAWHIRATADGFEGSAVVLGAQQK